MNLFERLESYLASGCIESHQGNESGLMVSDRKSGETRVPQTKLSVPPMPFFIMLSIFFAMFGTVYAVSAWLSHGKRERAAPCVRPTPTLRRRAF